MLNVIKSGSTSTLKYASENKEAKLSELAKSFFKNIDFSAFDKDFVEQNWKHDKIKKISAKITIKDGVPDFDAPYGHNHTRYPDLKYVLIQACRKYKLPDCEFIVFLNDAYASQFPAFSTIRRIASDVHNIPFPMGNMRGKPAGYGNSVMGWDEYVKKHVIEPGKAYSWEEKMDRAVFRGQYSFQTWALRGYTTVPTETWTDVNRGHLYKTCQNKQSLFDVGLTRVDNNKTEEDIPLIDEIPFPEQQAYKYIISVGTNANWAERLRTHLYTNSVLFKHEAECIEWFYPLMEAWKHYIPFDLMMVDLEKNVKWAKKNDNKCREIVSQANKFAKENLNEETMFLMAKILIEEYQKQSA
jgi:hypothetical protein